MPTHAGLTFLLLALVGAANAFYLPGVAPRDYTKGEDLNVKVEALTSVKTQLPYEYYVLPFCQEGIDFDIQEALNLGEVLRGSRIYNTPYDFHMAKNQQCKILCRKVYDEEEIAAFSLMVEEEYRANLLLDNLPVAMSVFHDMEDGQTIKAYETGYPLGHVDRPTDEEGNALPLDPTASAPVYLFNHLRFKVLYNADGPADKMRVVGFEVEPFSVKHGYVNEVKWNDCVGKVAGAGGKCSLSTCGPSSPVSLSSPPLQIDTLGADAGKSKGKVEVIWTYDVEFQSSPIRWSTRWDTYLQSADDAQVHWFSILNSFMIVLFLSGIVAMIMVRTLRKDFQRYEQAQDMLEDGQEETGWKLVHGDVFRPPPMAGWLAVLVGTGVQLCVSIGILMAFACFGFLSPANRGALMQAALFLFVFMGTFGGYTSARLFKMFRGTRWRSNAVWTAMLFPGICFGVFFVLNLLIWGQKSSGAVPFGTLLALLCMWMGISVPLVLAGAFFGFRKAAIEPPTRINQIPRNVPPQPWFVNTWLNIIVGGVLPFGAVFVEVFYVLSSVWLHQIYYLFGFVVLVLVILILTCCEITIVTCYFQLCCEDYRWWWRAFATSGSCAFYIFLHSVYYAYAKLQMARAVAGVLYVGYMLLVSMAFFLATGAAGFLACFFFVRAIYAAIKID